MKKLNETPVAWGNGEPGDEDWDKDLLIERLLAEGHHPISVDRAVVVIEQCEPGDSHPPGWAEDPLRIRVYPDPDAGFGDEPDDLFVNAGRSGLMDLYLRRHERPTLRLLGVDHSVVERVHDTSDLAGAHALLSLIQDSLTGYYSKELRDQPYQDTSGRARHFRQVVATAHDEELARRGRLLAEAVESYIERLEELPGLFRKWDEQAEG